MKTNRLSFILKNIQFYSTFFPFLFVKKISQDIFFILNGYKFILNLHEDASDPCVCTNNFIIYNKYLKIYKFYFKLVIDNLSNNIMLFFIIDFFKRIKFNLEM